ncbi:NfeD family protein [Albidovulum aquaemixtae]|uniref:NfeD family protein n=1 Tax=Albidovulum aquaemixtae TaxID=1542388 RepID=UPI001FE548C7|nr:nodulation protein NfeD [Defluviimonas aquaemixtae]
MASLIAVTLTAAQIAEEADTRPIAILAAIEGPIGPATVHHVDRVLDRAAELGAEVVILRLNTPGGLADAMREIITSLLASPAPVIGHVAPSGAHAASAGTYILYATHLAAMAPGTNVGAATPVSIGGLPEGLPGQEPPPEPKGAEGDSAKGGEKDGDDGSGEGSESLAPEDAMTAKATNDAVALIRSLAEMHGRNADWAEEAVRQAASLSAEAALEKGVIDIIARDEQELLAAADGRKIIFAGEERVLSTNSLVIERVEMDAITRILSVLSNPNIALILMMVGIYGIVFEFWNPGAIVPGVIGAISLMLGLYALNQLPLDYAGLALLILGIGFMVAEAVTPAFGVLGLGGLVAFVVGSAMLVDTDVPEYQISWLMIGTMAAVSAAVLMLLLGFTIRVYKGAPVTGRSRMIGAPGRVVEWSGYEGYVWVEGERWHARCAAALASGQAIRVLDIDGLTLSVEPAAALRGAEGEV